MPNRALHTIFEVASPFLRVKGLLSPEHLWLRDVGTGDSRREPWKAGAYQRIDECMWARKSSCLYIVQSSDGGFRYVGVSGKGIKQRWREAPALDVATLQKLPAPHIFHRPCWKNIQQELESGTSTSFEVRVIFSRELRAVLGRQSVIDLAALCVLTDSEIVNQVEVWFRARRIPDNPLGFLGWNKQ
jgi:hypothetical protein